jgi:hypothetical protein
MKCPNCKIVCIEVVRPRDCKHEVSQVVRFEERLILGRLWLSDPKFRFNDRPVRVARIEKNEFDGLKAIR